jgi:putative flippase GtrA
MRKLDLILGAVIGFLNGIFFFFFLNQIAPQIIFLKSILPYRWVLILIFPVLGALAIFIGYLIGKKFSIFFQAVKFFLVGTLNTFIDLGILNFFIWITGFAKGIFYAIFKTISFLSATANSYLWNKYWTFEKRKKPESREFLKFLIVTTIGLLINVGVASFIVNVIGPQFGISEKIWATIGAIIAAFFAFVWNFLSSKFIVFKK